MPKFGSCPQCGQTVNADPGESVPNHTAPGEQKTCSGTGSNAQ